MRSMVEGAAAHAGAWRGPKPKSGYCPGAGSRCGGAAWAKT